MKIINSWIFWVILYLISAVIFAQSFKKANRGMKDAGALTILLEVFTAVFAILFIPFFNIIWPTEPVIYITLFFVVIIYAFTDRLNIEARYGLDPSVFSMLKQLSTVFLLVLGFIFLKESIVFSKTLGASIIILANLFLVFNKGKICLNKYFFMSIASNLLFAIAMFINVNIADHFNLGFYTFITVLIPAILIFIFGKYKFKNILSEFKLYDKKLFLLSSFSWTLMLISSVRAYQLNSISVVAPLLTLTALLNAIYEFIVNRDRKTLIKKIVAFLLILIGVILIK